MATEFIYFERLPTEVRYKIWEFCIPDHRIMELDFFDREIIGTSCRTGHTSYINAMQPTFSKVCHESRKVAFEQGDFQWEPLEAKLFSNLPIFNAMNAIRNPWFFPRTDIVHLSWDPSYTPLYCTHPEPIPVLIALSKMAQGVSIMAKLLVSFKEVYTYPLRHPKTYYKQLQLLEQLKDYKVCIRVINIHATDKLVIDSGLFGGLASPVQLIHTSDHKTIRRMYDLWRSSFSEDDDSDGPLERDTEPEKAFHEMIHTPDAFEARVHKWEVEVEKTWIWHKWHDKFVKRTLNSIDTPANVWTGPKVDHHGNPISGLDEDQIRMPEHDFNRMHPWVKGVLDNMPNFRPTIMFRYCSKKCYLNTKKKN
jgi:hypothetical protein